MFFKKALLITYHFPPSAASGAFRLLGFARHLPTFGWQPLVVAPPTLPWEPTDSALADGLPEEVIVESVPYPSKAPKLLRVLAQNAIWLPAAWFRCLRVIREYGPDVILTSGPPHCVHVLGHYLKRMTALPWVADFRDPWISGTPGRWSWSRWRQRSWERTVFQNADLVLANAPNARRLYAEAYPSCAGKVVTVTNGFDPRERALAGLPLLPDYAGRGAFIRLLHTGEIYAGRDPLPLFEALARLNAANDRPCRLEIMGRCELPIVDMLRRRGWDEFVALEGQRSYQETLAAMDDADILVLFDSPGRTVGVPAKLYEYLGAGRPILALAEPNGDTAAILRASGVPHRIAPPTDLPRIAAAVRELVDALPAESASINRRIQERFTRAAIAQSLAGHFDRLIGEAPTSESIEEAAELQEICP